MAAEIALACVRARRELRNEPIEAALVALRSQAGAPRLSSGPAVLDEARRLGIAVTRTLRLLPGDTRCLTRSLVLTLLLSRRGVPVKLVIGARAAPRFTAHAWVEYEGHAVLAPGDGSFGRLVEL